MEEQEKKSGQERYISAVNLIESDQKRHSEEFAKISKEFEELGDFYKSYKASHTKKMEWLNISLFAFNIGLIIGSILKIF
jgi:hypothetical protein